jgi:hypothetical protein
MALGLERGLRPTGSVNDAAVLDRRMHPPPGLPPDGR